MAEKFWLDREVLSDDLDKFFAQQSKDMNRFGSEINQVVEAFVFAQVVAWHREHGWTIDFEHPKPKSRGPSDSAVAAPTAPLRLKFSTRGKPSNYSFAQCTSGKEARQVRHGLRVMTAAGAKYGIPRANIVLDVAVIADTDLSLYTTDTPLPNDRLITFGEAKHMSAFAELVASFLGMVSELQPFRLRIGVRQAQRRLGLLPFLFVSGFLNGTALGLEQTIKKRGFAVNIYTQTNQLSAAVRLSIRKPPTKPKPRKSAP